MKTFQSGDHFSREFNQADRYCEVIAVIGNEALFKYTMPAGRVFLGVLDFADKWTSRAISLKGMPKKWIKAINDQNGELTIDEALANLGYHDRGLEYKTWALEHRVPQWIKDLNDKA